MGDLNIDLVDARSFLAVDATGSIRSAAKSLGVPVNTLRYRLDRLEQRIGGPLFRRMQAGVEITAAGTRMRKIARSMIDAAREGVGDARDVLIHPGQITIACGEGIGSVWLTPMIGTLQARVPDLITALHCDYDLASDHSERADVGITFFQPADPDLIVARLGTLHFRCYGTESYFKTHGIPERPEDMRHHKFIEQAAPGVNSQLREFFIGGAGGDDFIRFRTNSSLAVYYAVRTGRGLAFMPTYISHLTDKLQMVDIGVPLKFEMRYFYHREARESPSVRTAIEWLKAAFDPHVYPYFADEFVHPDDCRAVATDRKVFPLFPSLQE